MNINYAKNQITLYGKVCRIDTLLKKFTTLSGNQVYNFLINRTTQLPRRINCMAMVSVLNNRIKFLHSNSISKEAFSKLQYYAHYSEHQLFMLFHKICSKEDFLEYRMNLFGLMLENYQALNLNDGEMMYLKNLAKQPMEDFPEYFNYISGSCLEQDDTFDGVAIEDLKQNLQYSASTQDVFDIAGKYGIELPQRLKREQYLEYIFDYMMRKGTYSEEMVNELKDMNITQISTYARRTGINMQPNMSKQDLITYLFFFLDQCEIPTTSVRELVASEKYFPLEFRVDLQAIDSFGSTENKKVIYYQNDQEDQETMNSILEGANAPKEEPKVEEYQEEPKVETKSQDAPKDTNPWKMLLKNHEEEEKKKAEEALALEKAQKELEEQKALEETLAQDIINETLAQIPEAVEEPDPVIDIDVKKVETNPELGTGKIERLANSGSKNALLWISLGVAVGIVAFCVIAMLLL